MATQDTTDGAELLHAIGNIAHGVGRAITMVNALADHAKQCAQCRDLTVTAGGVADWRPCDEGTRILRDAGLRV